jgi:hypothetical protein
MPGRPKDQSLADVDKCMNFLKDLEVTWSGAGKSRAIIEQLLHDPGRDLKSTERPTLKRSWAEFDVSEGLSWDQLPASELFSYEASGTDLLGRWMN